MTSNPESTPPPTPRPSRGWAWLVLAMAWVGLMRVPLVLNARSHLDSDLAVDGLTLIDALGGRWRWHYPATPFIGSPPVLLSWAQARIWGPGPIALVSGGVLAYALIVAATFLLNRRAFGPSVATWGLVPLAFASTGMIWLSGRVTGGHLLATAWHAGAFAILWDVFAKGGWRPAAILGLWCGFGLYVDSMFAVTWVGLAVAMCVSAALSPRERAGVGGVAGPIGLRKGDPDAPGGAMPLTPGPSPGGRGEAGGKTPPAGSSRAVRAFACLLAFGLASGVGVAPRVIGARVDPHDAYVGQFQPVTRGDLVARNAKILLLDCLPRLVAGHRLPRLEAEPDPSRLPMGSPSSPEKGPPWLGFSVTAASLGLFAWAMVGLAFDAGGKPPTRDKRTVLPPSPLAGEGRGEGSIDVAGASLDRSSTVARRPPLPNPPPQGGRGPENEAVNSARRAIRWGLLASTLAVLAGFLIHPSITNSDNYRYLVFWLVPWSSGFGLMMARLASRRPAGAWALAMGFAALMTVDSARWYARFGWVDSAYRPARKAVADPALDWLDDHPGVSAILGDYWDVYRLSFLTGGRVRGVPFPQYPDRFPEIRGGLPPGRDRVVIVRPGEFGPLYRARALAMGAREVARGEGLSIVEWPEGMLP